MICESNKDFSWLPPRHPVNSDAFLRPTSLFLLSEDGVVAGRVWGANESGRPKKGTTNILEYMGRLGKKCWNSREGRGANNSVLGQIVLRSLREASFIIDHEGPADFINIRISPLSLP